MSLPRLTAEAAIYMTNGNYRSSSRPGCNRGVNLSQGLAGSSYLDSCYDCFIYGISGGYVGYEVLYCTCPDFNGNPHQTELSNPEFCTADIANCNGQLTCGGC